MGSFAGGREHDANSVPGKVSDGVFQPALEPPEACFSWHETGFWVPEKLFVVFANGVSHEDGGDFGAHGVGWWVTWLEVLVSAGGGGKSLGLCCSVAGDRGCGCLLLLVR